MEQLNLPFRLGMDYEELEFDLEILPDRLEGYDSYIYLGKFNNFLNYSTDRIELLFSMDVLEGIIITLPLLGFEDILAQLNTLLVSAQTVFEQDYRLHKFFDSGNNLSLYCTKDAISIIISNSNITYYLHLSLLCCHF